LIYGLNENGFDNFMQKDHDPRSKKTVMNTVFPIIQDIQFREEKLFANLDPLAKALFLQSNEREGTANGEDKMGTSAEPHREAKKNWYDWLHRRSPASRGQHVED
jgi:hypothetical protein